MTPPTVVRASRPLTLNGKTPAMLYYGAEYCPFCAAERWAMTAALSRFGTWSGLKITASSHTDSTPATNTFSYHGASLSQPVHPLLARRAVHQHPDASFSPPTQPCRTRPAQEQSDPDQVQLVQVLPECAGRDLVPVR